jgi:hypothetical protein
VLSWLLLLFWFPNNQAAALFQPNPPNQPFQLNKNKNSNKIINQVPPVKGIVFVSIVVNI